MAVNLERVLSGVGKNETGEIYRFNGLEFTVNQFPNTKGRPCEDAFCVVGDPKTGLLVAVADGITRSKDTEGRYPDPSPAAEAANLAVETAAQYFLKGNYLGGKAQLGINPTEAVVRANQAVRVLNESLGLIPPTVDYGTRDYAGTSLTVVEILRLKNGLKLNWASIADSPLIVFPSVGEGNPYILNPMQTAAKDRYAEQLKRSLGLTDNNEGWREWYRQNLRNKPYFFENYPYNIQLGYGALTGEPEALSFIVSGEEVLPLGSVVLIATDGILPVSLSEMDKIIREGSANLELVLPEIFGHALSVCCEDRRKHTDDMTAVLIRLSGDGSETASIQASN